MPKADAVQCSVSLFPSNPKAPSLPSHLTTRDEHTGSVIRRNSMKTKLPSFAKANTAEMKPIPSSMSVSQSQSGRRSLDHRTALSMEERSNASMPIVVSSTTSRLQQSAPFILNRRASNRAPCRTTHPMPQQGSRLLTVPKPKCTLPATTCQFGYVTPSKLFNMMGYGVDNQYLFMLTHYLYIVDCRTRDKFNSGHIVTAIHWEDALNGSVYISVVDRFSELVLYDDKGIFFNTTPEMRRVSSRFSTHGSKGCLTLSGGFEAFQTSFPFVCTPSEIRSLVDREKFLTIYPSVVLENQLYLGTGHQATHWKVIRDLKLTHIINISVEHPCVFNDRIEYLHIELDDLDDAPLNGHFDEAIHFMDTAFKHPSARLLVHCHLGISRSTTIVLAYLMKTFSATLADALKFLRHRRPIVCPNPGFLHQLIRYETELFSRTISNPNDPIFH